jgi:hypothetical protein
MLGMYLELFSYLEIKFGTLGDVCGFFRCLTDFPGAILLHVEAEEEQSNEKKSN